MVSEDVFFGDAMLLGNALPLGLKVILRLKNPGAVFCVRLCSESRTQEMRIAMRVTEIPSFVVFLIKLL